MAQPDKKVYVDWPLDNEESFRFVSSRLDEESEHENDSLEGTPRLPTPKSSKPNVNVPVKQITVSQKPKGPVKPVPVAVPVPIPAPDEVSTEDDAEELQREAAYQAELQARIVRPQQVPAPRSASSTSGDQSPVPPLNFNDIDRSSMQDFFMEEIDINLRSSSEDEPVPKPVQKPDLQLHSLDSAHTQESAHSVAKVPDRKPPVPVPRTRAQPRNQPAEPQPFRQQFPQEASPDSEELEEREEQPEEAVEDRPANEFTGGEIKWAKRNVVAQKTQGKPPLPVKKNDKQPPSTNFVAENKQLKRDKPKKSYATMLRNKQDGDGATAVSTSAPARANGNAPKTGVKQQQTASQSGDRKAVAEQPAEHVANMAPPPFAMAAAAAQFAAAAMYGMSTYPAMMQAYAPPMATYYQQPMPAYQQVAPSFVTVPYAAPAYAQPGDQFGGEYAMGVAEASSLQNSYSGAQFHESSGFQRQMTHASQPELARMKSEASAAHSYAAAGKAAKKGSYAQTAERSRTMSDSPTHPAAAHGDVYTVVTLQRHASPLPPIHDHLARAKQNAEHGIPASVAPNYDAGYRDLYAKQKQGPEYKKYTLRDYKNIKQVDKLDHRLGPDLDSAEYRERMEKRKRQQMYGRRVNTENVKMITQEREAAIRAKQDGPRSANHDESEDGRERKRLEVVDIGDPKYVETAKDNFQKLPVQRSAPVEKTSLGNSDATRTGFRRVSQSPPPLPQQHQPVQQQQQYQYQQQQQLQMQSPLPVSKNRSMIDEQSNDLLNVRTVPPASGSAAEFYNHALIDAHHKLEMNSGKAAVALPQKVHEAEFARTVSDTLKEPPVDEQQKQLSKRELAKQYAEQIRKQHMDFSKKKRDSEVESQRPVNSIEKAKSAQAQFTYEGLEQQLARLHERHLLDKSRADAIRQAY